MQVRLPVSSDDVHMDFSLKVLGSEAAWYHILGSDAARISPEDVIDEYFSTIDNLIHNLKNSDVR